MSNAIIQHPTIVEGTAETVGTRRSWGAKARDWARAKREEFRTNARRAAYGAEEFARRHPQAAHRVNEAIDGAIIGASVVLAVAAMAEVLGLDDTGA